MKLVESILTKNPCYTAGRKITVKGLMLHSVGCPQPKASVFVNGWNSASQTRACVHGFIDALDGTIYQTLPWNHRGWHAGGAANNTHIGVEMCEPACIKYTSGAAFTCSDTATAKACATRTYEAAVELFAMLCQKYNLNPLADGVIISHKEGNERGVATNHGDPEHLWRQLGMSYTMDTFRKAVKDKMSGATTEEKPQEASGTQGTAFLNLSTADAVSKIGKLCQADMKASGILASISAAQFILESGYGKSELAQKANNCFGMKCSLSGNTWSGSTWDGKSKHTIETQEEYTAGEFTTITADFRKYACVEDSIADHSAYLLGAMNGSKLRYDGLKGCTDYKKAAQLIKDGGYATSSTYVEKLCNIIEKYNLTQYDSAATQPDTGNDPVSSFPDTPFTVRVLIDDLNYRSQPSMDGAVRGQTGKGVFTITKVTDGWGKLKSGAGWIYLGNPSYCTVLGATSAVPEQSTTPEQPIASGLPYKVRVSIPDLNIRTGPGTNYGKTGKFTGKGVFTIVEEADGQGASKWGLLKSYAGKRNGWIALDYAAKI